MEKADKDHNGTISQRAYRTPSRRTILPPRAGSTVPGTTSWPRGVAAAFAEARTRAGGDRLPRRAAGPRADSYGE